MNSPLSSSGIRIRAIQLVNFGGHLQWVSGTNQTSASYPVKNMSLTTSFNAPMFSTGIVLPVMNHEVDKLEP